MSDWKIETPEQIKCPFKCNRGWLGEPNITTDSKGWRAESQCRGCGAYSIWYFNPDKPFAEQKLYVCESYEGFWEPPQ
jgi:hypothetical protein